MPSRNHIHQYKRVNLAANKKKKEYIVFKCILSDCSHYVPEALAEGRTSKCNYCDDTFQLTKKNMMRTKPHCGKCRGSREIEDGVMGLVNFVLGGIKPVKEKEEDAKINEGS